MSKGFATFVGFVVGSAVGTLVGILYAPDKGKDTRDKLSFHLAKAKEKLQEAIDDLMDNTSTPLSSAQEKGQRVVTEVEEQAEKLLADVEKMISHIQQNKKNA